MDIRGHSFPSLRPEDNLDTYHKLWLIINDDELYYYSIIPWAHVTGYGGGKKNKLCEIISEIQRTAYSDVTGNFWIRAVSESDEPRLATKSSDGRMAYVRRVETWKWSLQVHDGYSFFLVHSCEFAMNLTWSPFYYGERVKNSLLWRAVRIGWGETTLHEIVNN